MLRKLSTLAAIATFAMTPLFADELAVPEGDVILTISGNVEKTNAEAALKLDLEMLEALETTTYETTTIWTEGVQTFEGVPLKALVEAYDITGENIEATAINDYTVTIPMSDAVENGALIAFRLNGDTMSVRDKGPLWIVYPYDSDAKFRTEVIFSRSIWQLDRLQAID